MGKLIARQTVRVMQGGKRRDVRPGEEFEVRKDDEAALLAAGAAVRKSVEDTGEGDRVVAPQVSPPPGPASGETSPPSTEAVAAALAEAPAKAPANAPAKGSGGS